MVEALNVNPESQTIQLTQYGQDMQAVQAVIEDADHQLTTLIELDPRLSQYTDRNLVKNAIAVLKMAKTILDREPTIEKSLRTMHARQPKQFHMIVLQYYPLVFSLDGDGIQAFAPVLTCTYNALGDLAHPKKDGEAAMVSSDNGLISYVMKRAEQEENPIISYHREFMKPEDYIALGAQGIFRNEGFRMTIRQGKIVKPRTK